MLLLDTSVLIEYFRKSNKENSVFYRLLDQYETFAISAFTKFEIEIGSSETHSHFWNELLSRVEVYGFDEKTAKICSSIYKKLKSQNQIIEFIDLAIGCTALQNNLEIATLNLKHFQRIENLKIISLPL